jgi:transposase, IS5 family
MLKLHQSQGTLWDAILPEPLRSLPPELEQVDQLLDDERFLQPFLERFHTKKGRPTVPVETYLRLMYLKFRYELGYETLVREVQDSLTWRRFCRINLDQKVPDATTLIKARKRYGEETIRQLNQTLVQKLKEEKILKHRKLRTDTTVMEANIHHPTDASLLRDAVTAITRTVRKIQQTVSHAVEGFQDRTREVKEHLFSMTKVLRRRCRESWEEVDRITQQVIEVTEAVCSQARQVLEKAKDKAQAYQHRLKEAIERTGRLLDQAKQVVSGNRVIPDRMVSFHDPDARPIKKGKLAKTTEFGYKVRIDETESGFITGYEVYRGNPSDEELLLSAVENHRALFGSLPHAVAADRGFSSQKNEKQLTEMGVSYVSIPRRGKKSKRRTEYERQPWFQSLQRFRAGGEAKISLLKRKYGLSRSRFRGHAGSEAWAGMGIMAHNLRRAAMVRGS